MKAIALIMFLLLGQASAATTITLPLDGYYRPGRYMPVVVDSPAGKPLAIEAAAAVTTELTQDGGRSIAPLLTTGATLGDIHVRDGPVVVQKSHALEPRENLVGVAGGPDGEAAARAMFPGTKVIVVHLDARDPLPGPPLAWQSLDGIVLTETWPGGLRLDHLPEWLAGGMAIAVVATDTPDQRLPWRPIAGGWVLRPNIAGPLGCDGNEDAYAPSATWHPDLPADVRWRIVAWGALAAVALLLAALLPKRFAYPAIAVIAGVAILFPARPTGAFRADGEIEVTRSGWEQRDRWTYFAGVRDHLVTVPMEGATWPVFVDSLQAERLQLTLRGEGAAWSLQFSLPADQRLAVMSRAVRPATEARAAGEVESNSPMSRLARLLYRDAGEPHAAKAGSFATGRPNADWGAVRCGEK